MILKRLFRIRSGLIGFVLCVLIVIIAILAPLLAVSNFDMMHEGKFQLTPIWSADGQWPHILGTDDVGRDVWSRLLYGARFSLGSSLLVVLISSTIGTLLGMIAGWFGGRIDRVISRFADITMALPSLLLALIVVTVVGQGLTGAIFAVALTGLPGFIRLARAQTQIERNKLYVTASHLFSAPMWYQFRMNLIPNIAAPLLVQTSLSFSDGLLNIAALGFLGLGAKPPTPEWGTMLADAMPYLETNPWLVSLPGLCILISVLAFNLVGDALRDVLDPKLRGRG